MGDREKRNRIGKYMAGVLMLVLLTGISWMAPWVMEKWQNRYLTGQVVTLNQESIEFLNRDAISISGRMRALRELGTEDEIRKGYTMVEIPWTEERFEGAVKFCGRELDRIWEENLLPDVGGEVSDQTLTWLMTSEIMVGDIVIPVGTARFETENQAGMRAIISMIWDMETEMVYYASACGSEAEEQMAESAGYGSYEEMLINVQKEGTIRKENLMPLDEAACRRYWGADHSSVIETNHITESEVLLSFGDAPASVRRFPVLEEASGYGYGFAVLAGPKGWANFLERLFMWEMFQVRWVGDSIFMETDDWMSGIAPQGVW